MVELKEIPYSESPLTARDRFRKRTLFNWGRAIGAFIVVALGLAILAPTLIAWLGDVFAALLLWFLLFHVWHKKPIWLMCDHCESMIETNLPWICGHCHQRIIDVDDFPFINRCGNPLAE